MLTLPERFVKSFVSCRPSIFGRILSESLFLLPGKTGLLPKGQPERAVGVEPQKYIYARSDDIQIAESVKRDLAAERDIEISAVLQRELISESVHRERQAKSVSVISQQLRFGFRTRRDFEQIL
jgi:hypothetical protein